MVESNNGEERLARIEKMIETLQRESAVFKKVAGELAAVIVNATPALTAPMLTAHRRPHEKPNG